MGIIIWIAIGVFGFISFLFGRNLENREDINQYPEMAKSVPYFKIAGVIAIALSVLGIIYTIAELFK